MKLEDLMVTILNIRLSPLNETIRKKYIRGKGVRTEVFHRPFMHNNRTHQISKLNLFSYSFSYRNLSRIRLD